MKLQEISRKCSLLRTSGSLLQEEQDLSVIYIVVYIVETGAAAKCQQYFVSYSRTFGIKADNDTCSSLSNWINVFNLLLDSVVYFDIGLFAVVFGLQFQQIQS